MIKALFSSDTLFFNAVNLAEFSSMVYVGNITDLHDNYNGVPG